MFSRSFRSNIARRLAVAATFAMPLVLPALALASNAEDDAVKEARLEGYPTAVALAGGGSSGFTYFLMIIITVIGVAVVFKSANRSHLD